MQTLGSRNLLNYGQESNLEHAYCSWNALIVTEKVLKYLKISFCNWKGAFHNKKDGEINGLFYKSFM